MMLFKKAEPDPKLTQCHVNGMDYDLFMFPYQQEINLSIYTIFTWDIYSLLIGWSQEWQVTQLSSDHPKGVGGDRGADDPHHAPGEAPGHHVGPVAKEAQLRQHPE